MYSYHGRVLGRVLVPRAWAWACVRGVRLQARVPVAVHVKGEARVAEEAARHYEEKLALKGGTDTPKEQPKSKRHEQKTPDSDESLRSSIHYKMLSEAGNFQRKLLENMKSPKYRQKNQLFVAEGHRIIAEALQHGVTPAALYFTRLKLVAALKAEPSGLKMEHIRDLSDLPLFKAPYKTLQMWSSVTTSPGIVGVFRIPSTTEPSTTSTTTSTTRLPLTLVLDELREPGNLGGVLRTAAAVGVRQVLLMKGCCDPWEAKVVRAGCGAHFRLTLITKLTWESLSNHMPEDTQIFLADVCREEDALGDVSEEVDDVDAAATKEGEERDVSRDDDSFEDNVYEVDEEGNRVKVDRSYSDPQHLELYQHVPLPTLSYDRLGLAGMEGGAVLFLGGEVGISNAAKKFVADNFGRKVTVPLANGMDSLNTGIASGVIMYEMQKQLHEIATKRRYKERQESKG